MQLFRGFDTVVRPAGGSVVTVGSFDGVHRGHRWLIEQMNQEADRLGALAVVVTFDPHPRTVLRGEERLLSTIDQKIELLEQAGARAVVVVEFTRAFATQTGAVFFKDYLIDRLGLQMIFSGEGNHFGSDRRLAVDLSREYGVSYRELERMEGISSTRIRDLLESGRLDEAALLLGGS